MTTFAITSAKDLIKKRGWEGGRGSVGCSRSSNDGSSSDGGCTVLETAKERKRMRRESELENRAWRNRGGWKESIGWWVIEKGVKLVAQRVARASPGFWSEEKDGDVYRIETAMVGDREVEKEEEEDEEKEEEEENENVKG
ncbi:hypothetical protein M0804_002250 [Polistes exclamans]|nr:hypothetical protein M0804_002250 [Polistes exclamans]